MKTTVRIEAYPMDRIQAGSVGGVTCARRQRTRSQERKGFRRVWVKTLRRVSRVRGFGFDVGLER